MCKECQQLNPYPDGEDTIEIGTTARGSTIFRQPDLENGAYKYLSDCVVGGWVVPSFVSIEELELIIADMKARNEI